jgi:hypothetical protein
VFVRGDSIDQSGETGIGGRSVASYTIKAANHLLREIAGRLPVHICTDLACGHWIKIEQENRHLAHADARV